MALFIEGTTCKVCNVSMKASDNIVSFPAFIADEGSKFFPFSDSNIHYSCLQRFNFYDELLKLRNQFISNTRPENRVCYISKEPITNPNDFIFVDYFGDNLKGILSDVTFENFKLSHLRQWESLDSLVHELLFLRENVFEVKYINHFLQRIRHDISQIS